MQKAGDTAGAQKLLMEDLASQTAGASAAAAETFQGKVAMLKKQMDDLSGGIVNGVETALEAMGVAFVNTTMFLENHKAVLALVTGALVGIGTAIFIYMLPAIGAAIVGLGGMAIAAWAAMAPFLPLIAACALLALGAYELITNWGTVCSFFQGLWKTVSEAFVTAWDATVSFLAGIWSDITGALETAWNAVSSFFVGLWNGIGSGIKTAWDTIKSFFGGIWSWITSFFTQWGPLILAVLVPFIGIPLLIWQHFSQIKDWLSGLWTDVTNGIKTFVADIAGIVPEIGTTIVNGFDSAVTFITDLPAQMLQWGEDAINGFINGIKSAATGLADAVKNVASTVASYLHFSVPDIGPLSDADTYGPDMINLISNGILSGIPNITSAAKQAAAAVSTAMQPSNVIPITAAYTAQMTGTYGASAISGPYGSAIAAGSGNGAPVYNITVSASGNVAQSNQQLATTISQVFMQNIKTLGKIG
jgi:phage-related protein